jgi:hypothetical protein
MPPLGLFREAEIPVEIAAEPLRCRGNGAVAVFHFGDALFLEARGVSVGIVTLDGALDDAGALVHLLHFLGRAFQLYFVAVDGPRAHKGTLPVGGGNGDCFGSAHGIAIHVAHVKIIFDNVLRASGSRGKAQEQRREARKHRSHVSSLGHDPLGGNMWNTLERWGETSLRRNGGPLCYIPGVLEAVIP